MFDVKIQTANDALFLIKIKRNKSSDITANSVDIITHCDKSVINKESSRVIPGSVKVNNTAELLQEHKSPPTVRRVNITAAHGLMCHAGEDDTRKSLNYLGYLITRGTLKPCSSCREAKAKKTFLPKVSNRIISTKPNERLWLDISTIKRPKNQPHLPKIYNP